MESGYINLRLIHEKGILKTNNLNINNYGDFYKPRKARFIPTFCKRINLT